MELNLLGSVELRSGGQPVRLGIPRQRCVLAVLAMARGQLVSSETLIDRVWGDQPTANVRGTLHAYISQLRRVFDETAPGAGRKLLQRSQGGYLLRLDANRVDLYRSRGLVRRAREADEERAAELLAQASDLWRGTPMGGIKGDWAHRAREALERERVALLTERFELELRLGRYAEAVAPLSAALTEYPSSESIAMLLMRALHQCGWPASALETYAKFRQRLVEDLGAEPGPEMQRLHIQILRQQTSGGTRGPAEQPHATIPAQLPAPRSTFVGRAQQLAELDRLLGQPTLAVAAIDGPAGVGKTALAVQWAHRVRQRFPDGQLHLDLRGYSSGQPLRAIEALTRLLQSLGVPDEQVPEEPEQAAALLRSRTADRRLLILLDNARGPEQVRPLLAGGGGSVVVVTSREQLGGLVARDGARRVNLDVLSPDEATSLLASMLGDTRVSPANTATTELARLCGYLPLALCIAAANLILFPQHELAEYAAQLRARDRLSVLTVSGDDQLGVRVAFDLSYQRLSEPARRTFRLLGLVPCPDLTAEVAAAVADCSIAEAQPLLDELATAHLVEHRLSGRYVFHDLLRLYAADCADEEDDQRHREAALERLYQYYSRRTRAASIRIFPRSIRLPNPPDDDHLSLGSFADPDSALAWLDAEQPNLLVLINHIVAAAPRRVACVLADDLRYYFWLRMRFVDWQAVANAAWTAATAIDDQQALAAAALNLAALHLRQGSYRAAAGHAADALQYATAAGWLAGAAACHVQLGACQLESGNLSQARAHLHDSVDLYRQLGDAYGEARALGDLSVWHRDVGELALARAYAERALSINGASGTRQCEADNLAVIGDIYYKTGQPDLAIEYLDRALEIYRAVGNRGFETITICNLTRVHRDAGRLDLAAGLAATGLELARACLHKGYEAEALSNAAGIAYRRGDFAAAARDYQRAASLARDTANQFLETEALTGQAAALRERQLLESACGCVEAALRLAREAGFRLLEGEALTVRARLWQDAGKPQAAVECAEHALAIHRHASYRLGEVAAEEVLAAAQADLDRPAQPPADPG